MENNSQAELMIIGASNATRMAQHEQVPFIYIPNWDEDNVTQLVEKLLRKNWDGLPKNIVICSPSNGLIRTRGFRGPRKLGDCSEKIYHLHSPQQNIRRTNDFNQEIRSLTKIVKILIDKGRKIFLFPNLMRNIVPTCDCKDQKTFYTINQIKLFANFESHMRSLFPELMVWKHASFVKDMYVIVTRQDKPKKTLTTNDYINFYSHFLMQDALHVRDHFYTSWYQHCLLSCFKRSQAQCDGAPSGSSYRSRGNFTVCNPKK